MGKIFDTIKILTSFLNRNKKMNYTSYRFLYFKEKYAKLVGSSKILSFLYRNK